MVPRRTGVLHLSVRLAPWGGLDEGTLKMSMVSTSTYVRLHLQAYMTSNAARYFENISKVQQVHPRMDASGIDRSSQIDLL